MMKVSAVMAFATFLVVGISSSVSVSPAQKRLWIQQCSEESNYGQGSSVPSILANNRRESCYWACFMGKWGMIKDGKLVEREKAYDIMVDTSISHRFELKDGKTIRQLVEECYDEANLKTEVCEIAGAMRNCVRQGRVSASPISTGRPRL